MSSITDVEKRYHEAILDMGGGYVLDYTDATFGEFFRKHQIDIHSPKYQTHGTSKAKKMRAFWEQEADKVVAKVLEEMLASYEANCAIRQVDVNSDILSKCRETVSRLSGVASVDNTNSVEDFLDKEFVLPVVAKLPVEPQVATIIEARLKEAQTVLAAGAYLSTIFLCGSVLEGVLLGAAQEDPAKFNRSTASPRWKDGKVKKFYEWNLAELINTAHDIGLLRLDVKIFAHGLRDFRNYIHPYQQLAQDFTPDEYTAKLCFQALKAALASIAGER